MPVITGQLIRSGQSANGGWSMKQFQLLGVEWPPGTGWKARIIGNEITEHDKNQFLNLKNAHLEDKPCEATDAEQSEWEWKDASGFWKFEVFCGQRYVCSTREKKFAKMIAALPDLLEACQHAVTELEGIVSEYPGYQRDIDIIKKAINKATEG